MAKWIKSEALLRRRRRVRKKVQGAQVRPRLSVRRSLKHIYAQVIDDASGRTIVSASSLSKEVRGDSNYGGNVSSAQTVGKLIAERARKANVEMVVFDRGGRRFHGRVQALADAAREGGLKF